MTRLQMSPDEARWSRERYVRDMVDLARLVGAPSSSVDGICAGVRKKFSPRLYLKEAVLPAREKWIIRFLRRPGCWLTTGEKRTGGRGRQIPGERLPRYVRLCVPVDAHGAITRTRAPREEDLRALVHGVWKQYASVPTVVVEVNAPRWGLTVNAYRTPLPPVALAFPFRKSEFAAAMRKLVEDRIKYRRMQAVEMHAGNRRRRHGREASAQATA